MLTELDGHHVQKSDNPNSWIFYDARIDAGYPTIDDLAEKMGVPKATLFLWQRGDGRPPARHIAQLHQLLKVPLSSLGKSLLREEIGDPCPCGCGHRKIFSEKFPNARRLAIDASCSCGTRRILKAGARSEHRKPCPRCAYRARRVKRITFTCIGRWDHNKYFSCSNTRELTPGRIRWEQKQAEQGQSGKAPNSRFDAASRKYQCDSCSNTERLIALTERALRKFQGKRTPHQNVDRIRTRADRLKLLRDLTLEMNPNLIEAGRKVLKSEGRNWAHITPEIRTIARLSASWSSPEGPKLVQIVVCRACGQIEMRESERVPKFHKDCDRTRDISESGQPGRRAEKLKTSFYWAFQHYVKGRSFGDLAGEAHVRPQTVEEKVKYLLNRLNPDKLSLPRFQRAARLVLEAAGRHQRPVPMS